MRSSRCCFAFAAALMLVAMAGESWATGSKPRQHQPTASRRQRPVGQRPAPNPIRVRPSIRPLLPTFPQRPGLQMLPPMPQMTAPPPCAPLCIVPTINDSGRINGGRLIFNETAPQGPVPGVPHSSVGVQVQVPLRFLP